MSNTSTYYYVLVFTESGPMYVTSLERANKVAHWDNTEMPRRFSMHEADDLAFGLRCNGYSAVTVKGKYEVDSQPYAYDSWKIKWEKIENGEE